MKSRRAVAAAFLLAVEPVALAGSGAAEVAAWLTGTFEARDPAANGAGIRIVVVSVPKSRIANGAPVLYREQAALPKLDEPSLQRFYRVEEDGEVVRLRAFDPRDPFLVRGKWRDPSALALYGANDVREKPGCEIALKRNGLRWEGGTREPTPQAACPSNLRNSVRMTSSVLLSRDELVQWDRGFDEKGRQTWSSGEGGTTFVKTSASAPVDDSLIERTVGRRKDKERDSLKVKEPEVQASAALTVTSPTSPSKKYELAELRAMAGSGTLALSRLLSRAGEDGAAATVIVVTSRGGAASVFSLAEISSSSSGGPSLDVSSSAPRLVAAGGRGLDDVVSIELRVLAP